MINIAGVKKKRELTQVKRKKRILGSDLPSTEDSSKPFSLTMNQAKGAHGKDPQVY